MNPYEEPQAELESPEVEVGQRHLHWLALFASGLICFIAMTMNLTIMVNFFFGNNKPSQLVIATICFIIPSALGAAYLGWQARSRWFAHAAIYSVMPPLITIAWISNQFRSTKQFLAIALIIQLASIFITMLTMTATRAIAKTFAHHQ